MKIKKEKTKILLERKTKRNKTSYENYDKNNGYYSDIFNHICYKECPGETEEEENGFFSLLLSLSRLFSAL